jgi:hypothetical protein
MLDDSDHWHGEEAVGYSNKSNRDGQMACPLEEEVVQKG